MTFEDELTALLMKYLGPDARPRDWYRIGGELETALHWVDSRSSARFTPEEFDADLEADEAERE
ncbi:hypothetical protein [Bradyrhizobium sp. Tv2a-2]|uniref:hypothetical protein n=1 Tax=Bradyrhizobium sp. Tv2a-2 TaxID=113395 RepID=UPI000422EB00|nr:hypothetical protein [Bradyrhizobium sp. Tv2a-2]